MKTSAVLPVSMLLGSALAVNMWRYEPRRGVDVSFKPFLKAVYTTIEDRKATTCFTDFFVPETGRLVALDFDARGAEAILATKQYILPPNGDKHFNYRPNVTSVYSDTPTQKTYDVQGILETSFDGGNCSVRYYSSYLTVLKDSYGKVRNVPHSGSLVEYNEYILNPNEPPTDIPCQA
ncbi:hypothetical protein EDB81DRAFT_766800 [Dactylonectria macrodidyma]|uniref:Uncharacterized protein n=1 Tax=Dactylonectria macrodidyma TaxID=307937 RepID=A0A9P9DHP1_9HYPO|nr:hypothetical protein EDB81DRAFT_766800 [Dactylonectria macrodidyma]